MRYYIDFVLTIRDAEYAHEFYNGKGFSKEYPDAQLYRTRGEAYKALLKLRLKFPNIAADLNIRDNQDQDQTQEPTQ